MGSNKRKVIFIFTVLISFLFIKTVDASVSIGSEELTSNNFVVKSIGNQRLTFTDDLVYGPNGNNELPPPYFLITFCTDSNNIISWYDNNGFLDTINFYNTNYTCMFPNSNYTGGHVVYVYGEISASWSVSGTSAFLDGDLTYYQPNQASWALLSFQTSNEEISIDYASGSIISQNQTLIDQNSQIIAGQNSIYDKIHSESNETQEKLDSVNSSINETNDTLKDSDSSGATDSAGSFFSGFTTDTFGLTSIITAPINLIKSITSSTCSPMGVPVPFVNTTMNLPCLSSIYRNYFGSFLDIYQTVTFGIVAYWVCVRIFALVKDFKNPEHDEIEVLDL